MISLRSLIPFALGLASGSGPALAVGVGVSALVVWSDRRAPVRAWRRLFPALRFAGVRRFPREDEGVIALVRLSAVCSSALDELREIPRSRRRELRLRIARIVRMGADLTVAREKLADIDAPEARLALERQIAALVPTASQLRATLLRAGANRAARVEELHALRACEQELRAAAEVTELDRWTRFAS